MSDTPETRLRADIAELKGEIEKLRKDVVQGMIDIAVLKTKMAFIAVISGIASSVVIQGLSKVFF